MTTEQDLKRALKAVERAVAKRDECIALMLSEGTSLRRLAELTGMSHMTVARRYSDGIWDSAELLVEEVKREVAIDNWVVESTKSTRPPNRIRSR